MRNITSFAFLSFSAVLLGGAVPAQSTTPCTYEVRDLGVLPGGSGSIATDLNESGQVVGRADRANGQEVAFLWLPVPAFGLPAGMNDLGHLPGKSHTTAISINASGQVTGSSRLSPPGSPGRAFVWLPAAGLGYATSGMHDIGSFAGNETYAGFINDAGRIVGGSTTGTSFKPFHWDLGVMTNLGTIGGGPCAMAIGVNEIGESTGFYRLTTCASPNKRNAWLWLAQPKYGLNAGLNNLGNLGGAEAIGIDLNDAGQVVGQSDTAAGPTHPFLWLPSPAYGLPAGLNDLGTLGGDEGVAEFIDDAGTILGWSRTTSGAKHGFLWKDGVMFDVNHLLLTTGWTVEVAHAINSSGQIAATAVSTAGETHAVLLEATGPTVSSSQSVRLGMPANPDAFFPAATGPVVSRMWEPFVDHTNFAPASVLDFVAIDLGLPLNVPLGIGTLLCMPPPPGQIFYATPGASFSIPVPSDCSFLGVTACSQAGSFTPGSGIELTNAIDLILGNV